MKAKTSIQQKIFFSCPECGSAEHSYGHLSEGDSFGPWYCDKCGCSVTGSITSDGADIEIGSDRKINTLVLLRLYKEINFGNPVHIVVEGMAFKNSGGLADFEHHEYFYNEHTCPWNYLRLPIKEGEDTDPHGIFVHQETIKRPDNYSGHLNEIEEWKKLFPSLSSEMTEDSQ